MDGSDHGGDDKGEHYGGVNQEIKVMIIGLINIQMKNINIINNQGLVNGCWRRWEVGPVLFKLPLLRGSPVTEPNV